MDELEGWPSFRENAVVAVHAGDVPVAAITTRKYDPTGERCFQRGQKVKPIDHDPIAAQGIGADLMGKAALALGIATRAACHRLALPSREGISVADEFERRLVGIAPSEEPGEVGDGRLKCRERLGRKQLLV